MKMYYQDCDGTMSALLKVWSETQAKNFTSEVDQTPWTRPEANQQEYFNFGFDDEKWRLYINKQILMRFERNLIQKHLAQKQQCERAQARPEYNMMGQYMNQPMYYPPPPPYGGH
eukprot:TRINITY_DN1235_c0_g1_i1.p2 TRINITY_DN1235_c0_g1~~TRINITY_DN1235_c0_g1_i1.p2  ORF type:complete len:115 (+),score=29.34 TRINITY_DN1235_c0_g1_i1:243-587(+)